MPEPSNFELAHRLDELGKRLEEWKKELTSQIAALKYVSIDRYDAEQKALEKRVTRMEQSNVWLSRTIVAILISALVTAAVAALMAGPP